MEEILRKAISICPECMENIPANIIYDKTNEKIMMKKTCSKHGDFEDILSNDPALYIWKNGFPDELNSRYETRPKNIEALQVKKGCPNDCGLCTEHKSAANCMIIDITNRCNLNCPICFANSNKQGRIVEYSFEEVVRIMEYFINQRPYHAAIAQISGGEPTLHPRIIDILKKAKELGFPHRMLNTNGIRMAKSKEFCKQIKDADCGAIYLSFDGIEPETTKKIRGIDLSKIKQKVIENCREVGLDGIMLVMTIAKGQNDHEVQNVLQFAKENNDVVAGVVFQPVALCGRVTMEDLKELRYTNSDLIAELRQGTNNKINKFYPLAFTAKLTQLLSWFSDLPGWSISAHDDCGFATLVQVDPNGEWKSVEDYFDPDGMIKWGNEVFDLIQKREIPKPSKIKLLDGLKGIASNLGLKNLIDTIGEFSDKMTDIAYRNAMKAYFLAGAIKFIKNPKLKDLVDDRFYMNIAKLLSYPSLETSKGMLLNGLMFIGSMHFQDAYNFDMERVSSCVIHYGVISPDDESKVLQIPFCSFNTIHREPLEKKWAIKHSKPLDKSPEQHEAEVQKIADEIVLKNK